MALLDAGTFNGGRDTKAEAEQKQQLLEKVRTALRSMTRQYSEAAKFDHVPYALGIVRERLQGNYPAMWRQMRIVYDPNVTLASVTPKLEAKIGRGFLAPKWTQMDLQKVLLHEFLHHAAGLQFDHESPSQRAQLEHNVIDSILSDMGYRPPLNPAHPL
jgi:hypothetical protein